MLFIPLVELESLPDQTTMDSPPNGLVKLELVVQFGYLQSLTERLTTESFFNFYLQMF